MKNIKKIIPAAMVAATLTVTAFASSDDIAVIAPAPVNAPNTISVNNNALEGASYIVNNDRVMLPVRAICENLGFTVEYDEANDTVTLVKLPVTISFVPTVDGYTFAKTAPFKLGIDPILVNDRTYVPQEFFTEVMNATYTEKDGVATIVWGEETATVTPDESVEQGVAEDITSTFSIKEIGEKSILVADYNRGDVVLHIAEETVITDKEGKAISLADLDVDSEYTVVYSPAMTLSIPPQTTAIKITQTENAAKDVVEGEVCEVVTKDGKVTAIVIGNVDDITNQTVLNISDETSIKNAEGVQVNAQDIAKGAFVRSVASKMTTRSIPPQKTAYAITVM